MLTRISELFKAKSRKSDNLRDLASKGHWKLQPLTPGYIDLEHKGYVKALASALDDEQIWNIALTGSYGVGKSSILREIESHAKSRVLKLSLSALAPINTSEFDDSVPKQARTATNRIQQEIVKQLLYREQPHKMPGSRFRRIGRFNWLRGIAKALLLGLAVAVLFLLIGWSTQIATVFVPLVHLGLWIHPLVWGLSTIGAFLGFYLLHGQFYITQFSAGSATVTLDDKSVSYFDQYLDEIVYFFEVSKRNIVIFEDIDRFDDSRIFETLRALNTLLNNSPQIDGSIHFIYAIKDSIFDRIGLQEKNRNLDSGATSQEDPPQSETVRANRTKFFDLVIPVVPFITHRSARNLAVALLKQDDAAVAPELLDLAGQYVPDMRLLKNVRNEFIVFHDRIFSGAGKDLKLDETDLFAMMLYKSTHLTDFEDIRIGTSKLDTLYEISRDLVTKNIQRLEGERLDTLRHLARINGAEARSERLDKRLRAHVRRTVKAAGFDERNAQFQFGSKTIAEDELASAQFWREFVSTGENPTLVWRNGRNDSLSFTLDHLAAELTDSMDPASWDEAQRDALIEQHRAQTRDLEFLRSANLGQLIDRPEFLVKYEETKQSFDAVATAILSSKLAYALIDAGYINSNFTLYTSTFHDLRVSPAATNFIIHHVERDMMDEQFELAPGDVDDVVRERGDHALKEPALYNIAILDRLLQTNREKADIMIESLAGFGKRQIRFMQAYLTGGTEQSLFIARFTRVCTRALVYLVSEADLDDASRLHLTDVALAHLAESKAYQTDSDVSSYLADHYAELETLTTNEVGRSQAKTIGDIFAKAHVTLPRLQPLAENVRSSFVERGLYEIGRENLEIAIGDNESLALDIIRSQEPTVYKYVLHNLGSYIAAVDGVSPTIESAKHFISVIEDVLEQEPARLGDVIAGVSEDCVVTDLAEISSDAWPLLAEHECFRPTFKNVNGYIETVGTLDTNLAKVLTSAGTITETGEGSEGAKVTLAKTILSAADRLPSADLRVTLAASLGLTRHLEMDEINAEVGELFALLLKHDLIADAADTYARLADTNWATREAFIHESRAFNNYLYSGFAASDLGDLLQSDKIDRAIKVEIAENAKDYIDGAGISGSMQLALFATHEGLRMEPDVVEKMARDRVDASLVIGLLVPHLASLGHENLFATLNLMGGDYPKLTSVGRKGVEIPNTAADHALLETLTRHGIVKTYEEKGSKIKVNRRHK